MCVFPSHPTPPLLGVEVGDRMIGWAAVDAVDLNLATIAMLQEVPKVNTRTTMSPRHGHTGGGNKNAAFRQSIKIKSEKS